MVSYVSHTRLANAWLAAGEQPLGVPDAAGVRLACAANPMERYMHASLTYPQEVLFRARGILTFQPVVARRLFDRHRSP